MAMRTFLPPAFSSVFSAMFKFLTLTWPTINWCLSEPAVMVYSSLPRGGTPWNFWWGCAARISKSRPNFRPKNAVSQTRFQTWPQKIHARFQTWPCTWLSIAYASVLNGSQLFLSHQLLALVAGKKNKFISFRERSPNNHTQFQTKMFKIYTRFQTNYGGSKNWNVQL